MNLPEKANVPTMYFIGVTTTKSSIMELFPEWVKALGLKDVVLKGIDLEIHADPEEYREVVEFIKNDELSFGALVTTHKIDLYEAAKDLFDFLDPYAQMFGELSSISKRSGELRGHAKDPISSSLALKRFVPDGYWKSHGGELLLLGAGGSAIAISSALLDKEHGDNIPHRVDITDINEHRLAETEQILRKVNPDAKVEYHLITGSEENGRLLEGLNPHSLVINATGMGKDRPGSPLPDSAKFPQDSLVWELNYRGERDFMYQALAQKDEGNLHVEDGWIYFLHGWTQVIAEVFDIEMDGERFDRIEQLSNETR
ncbi:shikimate dehydrogenase [Kroppenstedtia eburnea]|uniref:Shikimate 5-dehydrogenase n=1 Tax=Kroppenstedtia eburnea TaxID=714067 RepID=A0A1N7MGA6_9BACL|nr:shikimate dehydrogenase [Kroppenstedtia eburnea]QKI81556.1 shikimate dehydrogenase [Kroppenstedtia eburnea]SIS85164.1 Shikimate 5-dehydrogenase [Kroppenstedtia eburnea]